MRNEGFSFDFGGVRMEVCSREVAFMFAASRTQSQLHDEGPSRTVSDWRSFGSLVRRVPWFCVASMALRNIPTSLVKCQKSIYVTSAIIFHYVPSTHHSQVSQHAIYFMTVHG